jgi:hypothetical protein
LTAEIVHIIEDDPTAVQELLRVAGTRMFDHKVEQIRLARASAEAYAAVAATYTAQGFTVIEHEPSWDDTSCVALRYLQMSDGAEVTEDAINDPARWAVRCSFSPSMTFLAASDCGDAGCLTRCHLAFVSDSCHFFRNAPMRLATDLVADRAGQHQSDSFVACAKPR